MPAPEVTENPAAGRLDDDDDDHWFSGGDSSDSDFFDSFGGGDSGGSPSYSDVNTQKYCRQLLVVSFILKPKRDE